MTELIKIVNERRSENVGSLPLHFFSHHKCATRWMKDYLAEFCSLNEIDLFQEEDSSKAPRPRGVTFFANAKYSEISAFSGHGCHIVRSPMSIVTSAYFSHLKTHPTLGWPQLEHQRCVLSASERRDGMFLTLAFLEREQFSEGAGGPLNSLETWNYDDPRYLTVRMEDLVLDPTRHFLTMLRHFGTPECDVNLPDGGRYAFERYSGGRRPGSVNSGSHYRSGDPDDWRTVLPQPVVDYFRHHFYEFLDRFYPECLQDSPHALPSSPTPEPTDVVTQSAAGELRRLAQERDRLYAEVESLYAERDDLFKQRENLYAERDDLFKQRENLYAERDELFKQRENLYGAR